MKLLKTQCKEFALLTERKNKMNDTRILIKSVRGRRHEFEGKENQDIIKKYEDDNVLCVVVNDGCSGCEYPETAAEISADIAIKIAKNKLIWNMNEKKFKIYVLNEYNQAFCKTGLPYEELCSTSAFVLINKQINSFIVFSIGDCTVLSYDFMLNVKSLAEPQNGLTKNMTFFTNTDSFLLKRVIQYHKGILKDNGISGFVLYSDGAENIAEQSYEQVQQLICANLISEETGIEYMNELFGNLKDMSSDDISVAVLSVITEKVQEAAHATYNGKITEEIVNIDIPVDYSKQTIKVIPKATICADSELEKKENNDNSLITFLTVSHTFDDILNSGIVKSRQLIPLLCELMKSEIIICDSNGRFIKK